MHLYASTQFSVRIYKSADGGMEQDEKEFLRELAVRPKQTIVLYPTPDSIPVCMCVYVCVFRECI